LNAMKPRMMITAAQPMRSDNLMACRGRARRGKKEKPGGRNGVIPDLDGGTPYGVGVVSEERQWHFKRVKGCSRENTKLRVKKGQARPSRESAGSHTFYWFEVRWGNAGKSAEISGNQQKSSPVLSCRSRPLNPSILTGGLE
jgi:hypothetical protein